jgi:DNA-binding MarR family transcriptional regulator
VRVRWIINPNNVVLDVWDKLNHAFDSVKKAHSRQMYTHNLTAPQFHVLEVLQKTGPIPLKRISEEFWLLVQILPVL